MEEESNVVTESCWKAWACRFHSRRVGPYLYKASGIKDTQQDQQLTEPGPWKSESRNSRGLGVSVLNSSTCRFSYRRVDILQAVCTYNQRADKFQGWQISHPGLWDVAMAYRFSFQRASLSKTMTGIDQRTDKSQD